jgi:protein-S-isoprenylcysteine O-methyltransferase Ste14
MIYPEKGKLIKDGMYKYIRNPQYLGRGIIAIGFGFFANNIIGILVGLIHFLSYIAIIPSEDKEMMRRFGSDFKSYSKKVPFLLPKIGNWTKFIRFVFIRK